MGFDLSDIVGDDESYGAATAFEATGTPAVGAGRTLRPPNAGQRDYRWERLSATFKAECRRRNALCHICVERGDEEHAQIDYAAKGNTSYAFETDHIRSWNRYPLLRYVWANLAPSHCRCNRQRRDEELRSEGVQQVWVKPDW
jgi:hypothetical protein